MIVKMKAKFIPKGLPNYSVSKNAKFETETDVSEGVH
jgi:hypothetical protein